MLTLLMPMPLTLPRLIDCRYAAAEAAIAFADAIFFAAAMPLPDAIAAAATPDVTLRHAAMIRRFADAISPPLRCFRRR